MRIEVEDVVGAQIDRPQHAPIIGFGEGHALIDPDTRNSGRTQHTLLRLRHTARYISPSPAKASNTDAVSAPIASSTFSRILIFAGPAALLLSRLP